MARQFKEPTFLTQQPTKLQSLLAPVSKAVSTLPELYDQYKLRRMQQQQLLKEQEYKQKEMESRYGTGTYQNIQPGTMTAPAPQMDESGQVTNPEEVLLGGTGTSPTFSKETPEQQLTRLGTEGYKALNPTPTQIVDITGRPVGYPMAGKVVVAPGEKPTEEAKADAKNAAKIKMELPKARGSFNSTMHEFDNMINEAQAIKYDPSVGMATGAAMGRIMAPGGATRVASRLDTLKSKTLLNVLSSMKELSKNGSSGFGALSDMEGENIRNSISTLNRKQSTEDFKAGLDRFIEEMKSKKQNLQDTFQNTYGELPKQAQQGLPSVPVVGGSFNGAKVLNVKRIE
jgi:hypothetical protein